jgi:hypothetical protein
MSGPTRRLGSAARALRTARAYRIARTVEALRGRLLELEVVLRDLTFSGAASNEDLGTDLLRLADQVNRTTLSLKRACQRIASMPPPPLRRRPPA